MSADIIMLDNMTNEMMTEAVKLINKKLWLKLLAISMSREL